MTLQLSLEGKQRHLR